MTQTPKTVDDYIAGFPANVQAILQQIRQTLKQAVPEASEAIKYGMPTLVLHGNMLSYGAYKTHIGIYPAPHGDDEFNRVLATYKTEKSTVRLPLDQPIPYDFIRQLAQLRAKAMIPRSPES